MHIGRRLANARKSCGLVQWKAAQELGISENALSRFERGVRPIPGDVIVKAAKLYGDRTLLQADPVLAEAIDLWLQAA